MHARRYVATSLLLAAIPAACQTINPGTMKKIAEVSPRFLSYNVETVPHAV